MTITPERSDLSWLLDDARALYAQGRKHGAILLLVCAVDALARARDPSVTNNKARFVDFLHSKMRRQGRAQIHNIGIPKTGAVMPFEELLYKFLRCPLVHEGARLKVDDPDIAVCLDWDTVPNGVKCDWDNNVVLLGGELAFQLLSDAVMHELKVGSTT
jgi:hypothetical protein